VVHRRLHENSCLSDSGICWVPFRYFVGEFVFFFKKNSFPLSLSHFRSNSPGNLYSFRMKGCDMLYQLHLLKSGCTPGITRRPFPSTLWNPRTSLLQRRSVVPNVVLTSLLVRRLKSDFPLDIVFLISFLPHSDMMTPTGTGYLQKKFSTSCPRYCGIPEITKETLALRKMAVDLASDSESFLA